VRIVAMMLAVAALGLGGCGRKAEAPKPQPSPQAPAAGDFAGRMAAVGTEPFWRVDINPTGQITFTEAGRAGAPMTVAYATPTAKDGGALFRSGELAVSFSAGPCSDGMSETAYPYAATVSAPGGVMLKGCGYASWSGAVVSLLPAIDACIAASGGRYAVIWAASDGAGARVRLDDGEPRECAFRAGKATFADTNGTPMASERDPLFVRAPHAEAAGECGVSAGLEVIGADGEVAGWLTTDDEC
jgi:uncharacterized membrane protein